MRFEVEGGSVFVRTWGPPSSDRAILLIHDSLGCVELWREFPALLAAETGLKVVAYDRLGFGQSSARSGLLPVTFIRDEAEVVCALARQMGLGRLILFGHSVGGAMAVAAAAEYASMCDAVISVSAQSHVGERTLSGLREAKEAFQRPEQFERLARYHGEKTRWVLDAWTETWLAPEFAAWSLDDSLRRVRCPLLALHGDRDEYGGAKHPERMARLASGTSRVVMLKGCGHVPHREIPERVVGEVSKFLEVL